MVVVRGAGWVKSIGTLGAVRCHHNGKTKLVHLLLFFILGETLNSSVVVLSMTLNSCDAIEEMILRVLLQFAPLRS